MQLPRQINKENNGYFYIIPAELMEDPEIPPKAKWLFGLLSSMANKTGSCNADNEWLAQKIKVNINYISTLLNKLDKKDWLILDKPQSKWREIILRFNRPTESLLSKNSNSTLEKSRKYSRQILNDSEPKIGSPSSNTSNNKDIYNGDISVWSSKVLDLSEEEVTKLPDVLRLYRYYLLCFKKTPKDIRLTDGRKKKIETRLKNYSAQEIATAFKNASKDDFYSGKKTSFRATLEWIVDKDERIERLRDLVSKSETGARPDKKILVKFEDGSEALVTDESGDS